MLVSPQSHFPVGARAARADGTRIEAVTTGDLERPVFNHYLCVRFRLLWDGV